jgi:hypothetical protein
MRRCMKPEFDLVVGDALDDLDSDAVQCARAAADDASRSDLECPVIDVVSLGLRQSSGAAIDRLPAVLEPAVAPQELYPWSKP